MGFSIGAFFTMPKNPAYRKNIRLAVFRYIEISVVCFSVRPVDIKTTQCATPPYIFLYPLFILNNQHMANPPSNPFWIKKYPQPKSIFLSPGLPLDVFNERAIFLAFFFLFFSLLFFFSGLLYSSYTTSTQCFASPYIGSFVVYSKQILESMDCRIEASKALSILHIHSTPFYSLLIYSC